MLHDVQLNFESHSVRFFQSPSYAAAETDADPESAPSTAAIANRDRLTFDITGLL